MESTRTINPWILAAAFVMCSVAATAQCVGYSEEVICNSNVDIDSYGNIEAYSVTQIFMEDIMYGWEAQVFGYLYAPGSSLIDELEGDDDGWGYAEADLYGVVTTPGTYEEDGEHYELDPDDYYSDLVGESSDTANYSGSCTFPIGEIPQDSGFGPGTVAPARVFTMTVFDSAGSSFSGRAAYEQWAGGAPYGCNGESLQSAMNYNFFSPNNANQYNDINGYQFPGWYDIVNGAPGSTFPCSFTVYQAMTMICAGTTYTWTVNEIDIGVDTGTVTVVHTSGSSTGGMPMSAGGIYTYP